MNIKEVKHGSAVSLMQGVGNKAGKIPSVGSNPATSINSVKDKIIYDSRERLPLWTEKKGAIKKTLSVGDYTTISLENRVHAERKSPSDLYGSIIQGHERFRNMFKKALRSNIKICVFVECSEEAFLDKRWQGKLKLKTPGLTLFKILATMKMKYKFTIIWCNDRKHMREMMKQWFVVEKAYLVGNEQEEVRQVHNVIPVTELLPRIKEEELEDWNV